MPLRASFFVGTRVMKQPRLRQDCTGLYHPSCCAHDCNLDHENTIARISTSSQFSSHPRDIRRSSRSTILKPSFHPEKRTLSRLLIHSSWLSVVALGSRQQICIWTSGTLFPAVLASSKLSATSLRRSWPVRPPLSRLSVPHTEGQWLSLPTFLRAIQQRTTLRTVTL